jgi:hypothetical protein
MYKWNKLQVFSSTGSQLSVKPQYLSCLSNKRQVSVSVCLKVFIYSLVGLAYFSVHIFVTPSFLRHVFIPVVDSQIVNK